jgi:hypothetical protein
VPISANIFGFYHLLPCRWLSWAFSVSFALLILGWLGRYQPHQNQQQTSSASPIATLQVVTAASPSIHSSSQTAIRDTPQKEATMHFFEM